MLKNATDVFVFGSNLAGIHGAGAAKRAYEVYGAQKGIGFGHMGPINAPSCYAIPTKDHYIKTLPLKIIQEYVNDFLKSADDHFEYMFFVTRIGCGLAGYKDEEIAPMFLGDYPNLIFDTAWFPYLGNAYTYFDGDL